MRLLFLIIVIYLAFSSIYCNDKNDYWLNELSIEMGGVGRIPISFIYSRQLFEFDLLTDVRTYTTVGISPLVVREIPATQFGITLRTGNSAKKGYCAEFGMFSVFGDTITQREDAYIGFKVKRIDFLPTLGIVYENSSTLLKFTIGSVLGQTYENLTAGITIGIRY